MYVQIRAQNFFLHHSKEDGADCAPTRTHTRARSVSKSILYGYFCRHTDKSDGTTQERNHVAPLPHLASLTSMALGVHHKQFVHDPFPMSSLQLLCTSIVSDFAYVSALALLCRSSWVDDTATHSMMYNQGTEMRLRHSPAAPLTCS